MRDRDCCEWSYSPNPDALRLRVIGNISENKRTDAQWEEIEDIKDLYNNKPVPDYRQVGEPCRECLERELLLLYNRTCADGKCKRGNRDCSKHGHLYLAPKDFSFPEKEGTVEGEGEALTVEMIGARAHHYKYPDATGKAASVGRSDYQKYLIAQAAISGKVAAKAKDKDEASKGYSLAAMAAICQDIETAHGGNINPDDDPSEKRKGLDDSDEAVALMYSNIIGWKEGPWDCPTCGLVARAQPIYGEDYEWHCGNVDCDAIVKIAPKATSAA